MNNSIGASKKRFFFKWVVLLLIGVCFSLLIPFSLMAAEMNDYCIVPPFVVGGGIKSNLLLFLDNSGSMFDLQYVDDGKQVAGVFTRNPTYCYDQTYKSKVCSNDRTQGCAGDGDCSAGGDCKDNVYVGYFKNDKKYKYDFGNEHFIETEDPFPAGCTNQVADTLCVNIAAGPPKSVTAFFAKGNYLNWLTSSKFDAQKGILTGGKYDASTDELLAESRGCVGRGFVKEANTSDFVNYSSPEPVPSPNTSLGVTFKVNGPDHPVNASAPSLGGQTQIDIFDGDYNQALCQDAIRAINDSHDPSAIRRSVEDCLSYDPNAPPGSKVCDLDHSFNGGSCSVDSDCIEVAEAGSCTSGNPADRVCTAGLVGAHCFKDADCNVTGADYGPCVDLAGGSSHSAVVNTKIEFNLSMQECWQVWAGRKEEPDHDAWAADSANCAEIYEGYRVCSGGDNEGDTCTADIDCTGGGTCEGGPSAIGDTNPALLCSSSYAGYCATTIDDWDNTIWEAHEYDSAEDCFRKKYLEYCQSVNIPPVIDPTDDPSDTSVNANLPAIIAGIGVEAQLGDPIQTFYVRVDRADKPEGLIQEFTERIRFGAMKFNYNGSAYECAEVVDPGIPYPVTCPKVCSTDNDQFCTSDADCPSGGECVNLYDPSVIGKENRDGGKIVHYIGYPGVCKIHTDEKCFENDDCSGYDDGETCNTAGDHDMGTCADPANYTGSFDVCSDNSDCSAPEECISLIRTIDGIRADAWTPFAEAYLEAIGYFARDVDATPHSTPPADYPDSGTSMTMDNYSTGAFLRLSDEAGLDPPDYYSERNPSQYTCQTNNILLISDGVSTTDQHNSVEQIVDVYNDGDGRTGSGIGGCPKFSGSRNLDDLAWLGQNWEITNFSTPVSLTTDVYKKIKTYAIYNGASSNDPDECNPETLLLETAKNGGGEYARAEDPEELKNAIKKIFLDVSGSASSGTAASVLASGEEAGANLLQAIFYPSRLFEDSKVELDWSGTLQNLWYWIDQLYRGSTIREDTVQDGVLNLTEDNIIHFKFDESTKTTRAELFLDADGLPSTPAAYQGEILVEYLKNMFESGKILWQRNLTLNPRKIKTYIGEKVAGDPVFRNFSVASRTELMRYLQAADEGESEAIIRYINGEDTKCSLTTTLACSKDTECPAGETCRGFNPIVDTDSDGNADFIGKYRKRTVAIDLSNPPDGDWTDPGEGPKVWKLGDIISSTPKVVAAVPLNTYHLVYGDDTYKNFVCKGNLACDSDYNLRGTVFTGANDGMLHAFKMGRLELNSNDIVPARIINPSTGAPCLPTDANRCGEEIWAFIPKHVLPFLKYNADPVYTHIFNVDGMPYVFDASIGGAAGVQKAADGSSWRTILIGSMKYGGATKEAGSVCTDCVKAPGVDINGDGDTLDIDAATGNDESRIGMSSYFAIDVTDLDPDNWKLLWEFSDENIPAAERADGGLGLSSTGPAVVRINPAVCPVDGKKCNGEWFVAIPSGPTGPIDTDVNQFLGRSDQKLKVFVIDLRTGAYKTAIRNFGGEIDNAFAGSSIDSVIDPDLDYQDDALYIGFTTSSSGVGDTWTEGGVVAVMTKENPNPVNWVGRRMMDGVGPVTAAIGRLEDTNNEKLWLFFGTGRYYYKKELGVIDDATGIRGLYGFKDPCYLSSAENQAPGDTFDLACATSVAAGDLDDVTDAPDNPEDDDGWFIELEAQNVPEVNFDAERIISDPVASTIGATFFTSFKPSSEVCKYGGRSHLWAVKYNTGGTATSFLRGKALMQVSTGSIEEIDLKTAFKSGDTNPDSHGDRRSAAMIGKPPEGPGLILLTAPPPSETVIHMREK